MVFRIEEEITEASIIFRDEGTKSRLYATFTCFLLFFFIVAALMEKYKPMLGHETGATVVLGIVWSFAFYYIYGNDPALIAEYTFNSSSFFDFILPPIIYNAGFNMRRKKFFMNLGNQLIFGLFVTIACFIMYAALSCIILSLFDLTMTRYVVSEG